ncbi:MAG: AraC family transcriptional regulator [Oscillospiraceae bacterium]|nr:AraC family transcriptional regulator [Oscillospiraceae bacterium]
MIDYRSDLQQLKISVFKCDSILSKTHTHNFLELAYVTQGSALHTFGNSESTINKGDYFIVDYDAAHSYFSIDGKPFEVINCVFLPEFVDRSLINCKSFKTVLNNYLIRFNSDSLTADPTTQIFCDNGTVLHLLDRMMDEYESKNPGYVEIMRCDFIEIIIQTMRKIFNKTADNFYGNYSDYAVKYISENYAKSIALSNICLELHLSLPYMSAKFKSDTGMTFTKHLQRVRVEQSCRLLANTNKKVIEIAQLSGFCDEKSFYNAFKFHMGMSPNVFRHKCEN